jgi:hypothetical protein
VGNRSIHLLALPIGPAALHVAAQEVFIHGAECDFGDLSAGSIVEKDEAIALLERRKTLPHRRDGKFCHGTT